MKYACKIIFLLVLLSGILCAQTFSIKGTVKDSAGVPLIGANVFIIGTEMGAASDENGAFNIDYVKPGNYTVKFSMLGFKSIEKKIRIISKNLILNVTMVNKPVESEEVVVTAGKYEQKISDLPVSASIIHPAEFNERDITNLADALRYVPGVNMTYDQVSIRGSSGYSRGAGTRVLLAIDGIPYYTGDTGEIIWEIIPVNQIKRVEIIKGAASSLYGSTAIGGVINVITKGISDKPSTYIKGEIGTYDKPKYSQWDWSSELRTFNTLTVSHSNKIGNFKFAASLSRLENLGYKQSGFYHRYVSYLKGVYEFSPSSSLSFLYNGINSRNGNFVYWKDLQHALVPPDADQGQRVTSDRYMFGVIYKNVLSDDIYLNFKGSYYRSFWEDQTTSHNKSASELFRGEFQLNDNLSDNLLMVSGVEVSRGIVNSNLFGSPTSVGAGIYSQLDYKFDFPLSATLGARYDYSKLDTLHSYGAVSPKLGLNYKLTDDFILRSSLGTGFRAPSLAEAFTTTSASGIVIKPNPDVKPEYNYSFEVGANYQLSNFADFDAAVFQNEFYDFIEPAVGPTGQYFIFDNITRARIQGAELQTQFSLLNNNLNLTIDYTYLWSRDLNKHTALRYRPRHMANFGAQYKFGNFSAGTNFRYWSKVEQIDFELINLGVIKDGAARVPVYVLDFNAGYNLIHLGIPAKLQINIKNALNYYYVELIGNVAPLRNYSLSMEFLF